MHYRSQKHKGCGSNAIDQIKFEQDGIRCEAAFIFTDQFSTAEIYDFENDQDNKGGKEHRIERCD